ncbi:glycoside hydrolase family 130 protein [Paenibacillus caseinilyticus]|uniref:Glycosidase n=1 Tax=Paenibacillus mucilaginosus K02 TaxID=997761 RepID=I0BH49_9BACL|nr:hypothetical protein [Paenibacillus mucilaginosus]AFH61696.1 hypothetical protein B2K_13370 [Paenibacillus mucilaginosus K02]
MKPQFSYSPEPVLVPQPGCDWASKMVLNPAIVQDPEEADTLHMLFRATGPWPQKQREGKYPPYPIFLGYAVSHDRGQTWDADFSRPALAPELGWEEEELKVTDAVGRQVWNYANGCIEDPRIFPVEGQLYLSAACRLFPPGPYWLVDGDPPIETRYDYVPEWTQEGEGPFYETCRTNVTVTVLYRLDLDKLKARRYEEAFAYVGPLTEGHVSDNRDVFLFPERMKIHGRLQYVMLHRPMTPAAFPDGADLGPSIYLAAAEEIGDFASPKAEHRLLAAGRFDWEENRIGASWPPLRISEDEWLVAYHGKKDAHFGYTQSFLIVLEQEDDFPVVTHRCSERMMYAQQEWEMPTDYPTPCLFTTAGIRVGDNLVMAYGAADQKVGLSWVNWAELVAYVRLFDADGVKKG